MLKNPDSYYVTFKEHTQYPITPKTVHVGRKDDGSGGGCLPVIVVLSEEESSDNGLEKGLQTQPTIIGRDQPFGQIAGKAWRVTLMRADNELVE